MFSTLTPSALNTSTPLRPSPFGPKSWSPAADEHFGEPGLVPSTTTPLRSRPRRWMSGVVIRTPAPASSVGWWVV